MLEYKLHRDPYDSEILFTGKLTREIPEGLTVLVGCNGYGKSTILRSIEEQYEMNDEYKVLSWSNTSDKLYQKDRALISERFDILAGLALSSEGEEININIGLLAEQIGATIHHNKDKNIIILLDGMDSGLSIDNIIDTKDFFKRLVIPDVNKNGKKCYVICAANEYELANGETCIDAKTGKIITFDTYEEYKNYILETRKNKNKRKSTR